NGPRQRACPRLPEQRRTTNQHRPNDFHTHLTPLTSLQIRPRGSDDASRPPLSPRCRTRSRDRPTSVQSAVRARYSPRLRNRAAPTECVRGRDTCTQSHRISSSLPPCRTACPAEAALRPDTLAPAPTPPPE